MTKDEILSMAKETGIGILYENEGPDYVGDCNWEDIERFAALVAEKEREKISDEWSMCVQSDLEHGVKSLNETAAKEFHKNYPEIVKFWGWLNERARND